MSLTPFACSVHTHSTLCDGRDTPEAMAAAAYAAGVKYFGVSCHSHTPIDLDEGYVLPAESPMPPTGARRPLPPAGTRPSAATPWRWPRGTSGRSAGWRP